MSDVGGGGLPAGGAGAGGAMVGPRLSAMMFLQFFVWGAWYVSMTGFINREGMAPLTGMAYTVGPIAAILSPFFLGLVADRFFPTQIVLGALHLAGGAVMLAVPSLASPVEGSAAALAHPFILGLLLHMLFYMPTLGLTSSISFHHLKAGEKGFPLVRVFGTIGWIVGNLAVSLLPDKDASASQFYMAGGAAMLLGLYSFSLPRTPPPLKGTRPSIGQILGLDALVLFKSRSFAVFIVCSFLLCIPLAGYYAQARNFVEWTGAVVNDSATFTMSFGQMSEIFFMLIMPLCFARLGVKWMLAVGMLAWVVRYGLFAAAVDDKVVWMVLGGVLLHGVCYDFFFVTGMIYVDKAVSPTIRGQAQGFLVLVTQGLGMLIGAQAFQMLVNHYTTEVPGAATATTDWKFVWLWPCLMAAVILIIFVALFKNGKTESAASGDPFPA